MPIRIPADWIEWTGWSCQCSLYYPPPGEIAVPELKWIPCSSAAVPAGFVCKELDYELPGATTYGVRIQADESSPNPILSLGQAWPDNAENRLLAFDLVTGRAVSALAQPSAEDCMKGHTGAGHFLPKGFGGGRLVLFLRDSAVYPNPNLPVPQFTTGGWVAFDRSAGTPLVGTRVDDPMADPPRDVQPSRFGVFEERASYHFVPWDSDSDFAVGRPLGVLPNGDALVYQNGAAAWRLGVGTVEALLGAPLHLWWLGGDAVDLVWGQSADAFPNENAALMTAKYSLDPIAVQGSTRVLQTGGKAFDRLTVGCGFAVRDARRAGPLGFLFDLEVVRLSDSATWRLPADESADRPSWWPLFNDCTEMFVERRVSDDGKGSRYLRIRLDSLGPPSFQN